MSTITFMNLAVSKSATLQLRNTKKQSLTALFTYQYNLLISMIGLNICVTTAEPILKRPQEEHTILKML